jgi:hypothetical protein
MHDSPMAEGMSAREFLERELRANPDVSFAEVQERARAMGLNVAPFLYGRARRALGLPARRDLADPSPAVATPRPAPAPAPIAATEPEPVAAWTSGDDDEADAPREDAGSDFAEEAPSDEAHDETPHVGMASAPASAGAAKTKSPAFEFAIDQLRINPDLSFQDLKHRASMANLRLMPIVYGRAKALLGLVEVKPRKPRASQAPTAPLSLFQVDSAAAMPRIAPAMASAPSLDGLGSLEQLIQALRELENERQRLRAALAASQACVDEAMENQA